MSSAVPLASAQALSPRDTATTIQVSGTVVSLTSGGFEIRQVYGSCGGGYLNVATTSATTYTGTPSVGDTSVSTGTGTCSTSVAATHVAAAAAPAMTLSGTVENDASGGFTLDSSTCGYIHVFTTSSTTGTVPAAGRSTTVTGNGSCKTYVLASNIGGAASAPDAPSHVLTMDYLGAPWGTTSVAYSSAAPYLTYAETGTTDASAIAAAGIKTLLYADPNRTTAGDGDELYTNEGTTFAQTCSGGRVFDVKDGTDEWVMNPASSDMQALYAAFVAQKQGMGHFDDVFEDTAGPLSDYDTYDPFSPSLPCDYSDASWISGGIALDDASPLPVFVNGMSGLDGQTVSPAIGLLAGSNTVGANFEGCYSSANPVKAATTYWVAMEDSELAVAAKDKLFGCMAEDTAEASTSADARLYAYASFLLSYAPATSIYRTEFATPSGLHVMPESELVALQPAVAEPETIGALEQSGGTYARQYGACYVRSTYEGPCAVVVNPGTSSAPFPFTTYHHTVVLSGNGVLDGGTIATDGAAPPSSLAPAEAVIAFP